MKIVGTCFHFTGIQHNECNAGVNYRALHKGYGALTLPCLRHPRSMPPESCSKFRSVTAEEEAAWNAEVDAAFAKAEAAIQAGKCHVCGANAEPSERHGRCIYNACGHRRGQFRTEEP